MLKQFLRHMDGINKGAVADAAAKAMAEHCDKRIDTARKMLSEILEDAVGCYEGARDEGKKGEARAWRAMAARISNVIKRM